MNKKAYLVLLSSLNIIRSFLLIIQALLSRQLVNNVNGNYIENAIYFALCILLNIILTLIYVAIRNHFSLKIEVGMKQEIYTQLLNKDINEAKKFHSGELSNIYLTDIQNIRLGLCETIPNFFLYLSRFIFAFLALIYLNITILIILFAIGIIVFISAKIYGKIIKKYQKQSLESDGKINAFMQESFENIKIVKATNTQQNFTKTLESKLKDNYSIKNKRNLISIIGNSGFLIAMQLCSAFTMIYGVISIATGNLLFGDLIALLQVVSYFESPISMFSQLLNNYNNYKVSKERIYSLYKINNEEEQYEIKDFDKIIIDNISFNYENKDIFKDFSLTINKNDTILLKGHSGCGKTTLFNLLLGFEKVKNGKISIISNNNSYNIKNCRNLFSYVHQENILFSGTIEDNIRLFVPDYNEDELIQSLKIACIYDEIMEKPLKLKTPLNERGNGLSIGQIQRILLAISLLTNKPILLLDEFTSALDKELEKQIVINVSKLNKTKIIITHRDINIENSKTIYLGEENE